jgi:hypothetical protein
MIQKEKMSSSSHILVFWGDGTNNCEFGIAAK